MDVSEPVLVRADTERREYNNNNNNNNKNEYLWSAPPRPIRDGVFVYVGGFQVENEQQTT